MWKLVALLGKVSNTISSIIYRPVLSTSKFLDSCSSMYVYLLLPVDKVTSYNMFSGMSGILGRRWLVLLIGNATTKPTEYQQHNNQRYKYDSAQQWTFISPQSRSHNSGIVNGQLRSISLLLVVNPNIGQVLPCRCNAGSPTHVTWHIIQWK